MSQSFVKVLPSGAFNTTQQKVLSLASFMRETATPASLATTITLGNHPLPDFTDVYQAGLLLDPDADYTISGNTITLTSAANGTDLYQIRYYFRASQ